MRNSRGYRGGNEAVYTIRVQRATLDHLHRIAESQHRTLAGFLRATFDAAIAADEQLVERPPKRRSLNDAAHKVGVKRR